MHVPNSGALIGLLLSVFFLAPGIPTAQEMIQADGPGDTYELFRSRGMKAEVPDCHHPMRHISEVFDGELNKHVFEFHVHKTPDNDRCRGKDRQRTELTVSDIFAPGYLGGHDGETWTYGWKFRLGENFQGNTRFFHIHQMKAYQGGDDGSPIVTLTARQGGDKLELSGSIGTKASVPLSSLRGVWVEVVETLTYSSGSPFSMVIKRVSDGQVLLSWSGNVDMSRRNVGYYRPKIGLYRGITNAIQDEVVLFADFTIAKGSAPSPEHKLPPASPPKNLTATAPSGTQAKLTWNDTLFNNMRTRIEMTTDGKSWITADTVIPRWEDDFVKVKWDYSHTISGLKSGATYYFRIRAENLFGNSDYSNVVRIGPRGENDGIRTNNQKTARGLLTMHPIGNGMEIAYRVDKPRFVSLSAHDLSGRLIKSIEQKWQPRGTHRVKWDRFDANGKSTNHKVIALKFNEYATLIVNQ